MFNKQFRFQAGRNNNNNNNNNNNKDSNNKNIDSNFDKTELLDIKCGVPHGSIFRTTPFYTLYILYHSF